MKRESQQLWPYGVAAALAAVPLTWLFFAGLLGLTRYVASWPEPGGAEVLIWIVGVISILPLALLVLDFASHRKAVLDIKGVKIDFSQSEAPSRVGFQLPENVGMPGKIVLDSSPVQIADVLKKATASEIVKLDLGSGSGWWVTRLLALAAGAQQAGLPRVIVFVGRKSTVEGTFLGWATPSEVVRCVTHDEDAYYRAYVEAGKIARQVDALAGYPPPGLAVSPRVQRYLSTETAMHGKATLAAVLIEQIMAIEQQDDPNARQLVLDAIPDYPRARKQPDRLTLARLNELLAPGLITTAIDLDEADTIAQLVPFLGSGMDYVALVRKGVYHGMLTRSALEGLVLRQLLAGDA